MSGPIRYAIPAQAPTIPCRSCGALLVFVDTDKGRKMPVDANGEHRGEPHWATCKDPKRFRKRDRVKGGP